MSVRPAVTSRWLDAVIVVIAMAAAVGAALRQDANRPNATVLWLEAAAVAAMVLILLLRHRAPFLAPAAVWMTSAALSFTDGRLIVGQAAVSIAGMLSAVLLGNLRSVRQSRVGLAVVVASAMVIVSNDPTHAIARALLHPGDLRRRAG